MGREISSVGVVGLGTMGAGIAEVFARCGINVYAIEVDAASLDTGRSRLTGSIEHAAASGGITPAERDALLSRITFAVGLDRLHDAELVVEAVPERLDLKQRIFRGLNTVCRPQTILATNTSSLPVTDIAAASGRPDRVLGMHFFNPAPVMRLVEVVRTVVTSDAVVADVQALVARLGKVSVTIGDRAGFVANGLLFGYLNQAVALLDAGYASREDIDVAMRLGRGLPMGPFAQLDMIGLDTTYDVLDTMYRLGGRHRRHAPVPLLRQMVVAGLLGRKSGRGFYTYKEPGSAEVVDDELTPTRETASGQPNTTGVVGGIGSVGVVGSGGLASGLAETLTHHGFQVIQVDREASPGGLGDLAGVDLIVEAVADEMPVKKELFAALGRVCKAGAILATTASCLPVIECAMATGHPDHVLGLHFFGPGGGGDLVEVVRTVRTAEQAVVGARAVAEKLGKTPVVCGDRIGSVVDALLFPYLNEAVRMLEARYASAEEIDNAMKLGWGYPRGPLEALDELGLDTALAIQQALYRESRDSGHAPAPLLEQLVTVGYLGRVTGRGFHAY